MFEVVETYLVQLISWIPGILCICLLFAFIGDLLFKN